MKTIKYYAIFFLLIFSCKVKMEPGGEIISTPWSVVEQDGKSLLLIYRDTTGKNYEDANGIHQIRYSTFRCFKTRKKITEYYNLQGRYLDKNSVLAYSKAMEVWKRNELIEQSFMDSANHLVQPSYMGYAKKTQKYFKDKSWQVNYYDAKSNPICYNGVTEQILVWDTIWQINEKDTSFMLRIKTLESKNCK